MTGAGVDFKKLSEWMGHSSIVVTLDTYGHLMPGGGRRRGEARRLPPTDEHGRLASLDEFQRAPERRAGACCVPVAVQ
jgi:hypothetical protein